MSKTKPPVPLQNNPSAIQSMFGDYYLEYASYVILERAVPHIIDGLKPVQRRILHAMERMDDGRFNKVANIVGDTMKYHPHGDASIGSALVTLGQKGLLIDTQGNWGNILTGDTAAAPRYIEARLSKFAQEVVFSPKVTEWKLSYDGRNKEPVSLPVKFPLLLAQGALGIAVGMSCLILPHNFNELIDAAISYLRGQEFRLYPDFATGGLLDASNYNDGTGNSRLRCRARLEVVSKKLIRITEIPYGTTTESLIQSIEAAMDKGKLKIAKIEDNTAAEADILIHLNPGSEPEKLCNALYAFTECQVSISPKAVVIVDRKPVFMGVSEILKLNVDHTRETLRSELEVKLGDLQEEWMLASLEKIFIEHRIYKVLEESESWEQSLAEIGERLAPYVVDFIRPVTREDIIRLTEIKIRKIAKYEIHEAEKHIADLEADIERCRRDLAQLTRYTIRWFEGLRKKYGAAWPRRTELCEFDSVSRAEAAVENETLYLDDEGFAGYGVRKGTAIDKCSTLSDVLTIDHQGTLCVRRIQEKFYAGRKLLDIRVLRPDDDPVFNLIYRDGKDGNTYAKRFRIGGFTREKEYQLTQGTPGTRIFFLSVHGSDEESAAVSVNVYLKNQLKRLRRPIPFEFARLRIKGRAVLGNIVTKNQVERISRIMNSAPSSANADDAVAIMPDPPAARTQEAAEAASPSGAEAETPAERQQQLDLGLE
ncbi:MAG TPA: DNA gyrase/topoisomerase IV subunit A [Candidatus Akkermansia intestinigallinarum]|uniref:DNA gyrase/topoisomerase IV subunit A n=1 Tax=Candidatus Akkermansia intestinigallinarum TaxID=2838431 RepID=A0A9D1VCU6_9BACT|nr:DNA gyrase/topoisomerase IV subunit A [Candidatus Akkermansia intestinigallinarum]